MSGNEEGLIFDFLTASTLKRLSMALESNSEPALKAYMGEADFQNYKNLASQTLNNRDHLSIDTPSNLIFVPGVMGSLLFSGTHGGVWWIDVRSLNKLDQLGLNSDGSEDANGDSKLQAFTTDITYEPLLAAILKRSDFGHVVYPFDWRKSLLHSADGLKDRILELYGKNGRRPVHLVGHSMGGLLIRTMLMRHEDIVRRKIGRIAFLGTPHYGSPAIASYLKNHLWGFDYRALLGHYISRKTFRTLRGVLGMMPAPIGVYPGTRAGEEWWCDSPSGDATDHPVANFDMYETNAWDLGLAPQENEALHDVLADSSKIHHQLHQSHNMLDQRTRSKMAVIAGVGVKTLCRLEYDKSFFGLWEKMRKITSRGNGKLHDDGDGTVPLASAVLENIGTIRFIHGEHGQLPIMPAVYEEVFRWLNGDSLKLAHTAKGALREHLGSANRKMSDHEYYTLNGCNEMINRSEYWTDDLTSNQSKVRIRKLKLKLENGKLPEFIKTKIL